MGETVGAGRAEDRAPGRRAGRRDASPTWRIVGGSIDGRRRRAPRSPVTTSSTSPATSSLTAAVEPHAHLDKAFLAELLPNDDRRPAGGDRGHGRRPAPARRRRDRRAGRAGGPAAGRQRVHGRAHARRHDDGPRAAQHRGARRGPPPGRRRHRRRDRGPVRLAGRPDRAASRSGRCCARRWPPAPTSSAAAPTSTTAARGRPPRCTCEIAAEHGVGVDLHTDETLDPSVDGLGDLAAVVTATGFDLPGDGQPLRQPRHEARRAAAGDRRGRRRRRHRRRRAAGDEPVPPGPRPPAGDAAGPHGGAGAARRPASSWPPAPTTCRTRSTRSGGPARSRPPG